MRILYKALSAFIILSYWSVLLLMHYDHRVHWPTSIPSETLKPSELITLIQKIRPILDELS